MKRRQAFLRALADIDREARVISLAAQAKTVCYSALDEYAPVYRWCLGGVHEFWHLPSLTLQIDYSDLSIRDGQLLVDAQGRPMGEKLASRFRRVRELAVTF